MLYVTDLLEDDFVKALINFCETDILDMTKVRRAL